MAETFDVIVIGPDRAVILLRFAVHKKAHRSPSSKRPRQADLSESRLYSLQIAARLSRNTAAREKCRVLWASIYRSVSPNWSKMQQRKDTIVTNFRKGLTGVIQANKIKIIHGHAIASSPKTVTVKNETGQIEISAAKRHNHRYRLNTIDIRHSPVTTRQLSIATELCRWPAVPASMVIIGGGIIGCELACVYAAVRH